MKKYILLLAPLALLTIAQAEENLTPSLATLRYSLDDLAMQLAAPQEVQRKPVVINNVNALTDAGVLGVFKQIGGTLAQQKERKLLAQDTMNGLEIFVRPGNFTDLQKSKIKNAIVTILNANSLTVPGALRIVELLGEQKSSLYPTMRELFASKVNTTARRGTAGFSSDVMEARGFYDLIAEEVAQARASNDIAATQFAQDIDALKQKLDSL
jgi:hypothetical protein